MIEPKNGSYITTQDFEAWQDYIGPLILSYEKCTGNCSTCKNSHDDDEVTSSIKTKNVTFVVTEKCNLNCTYCYETHKSGSRMSKEVAKDAVDFLFDKEKVNGYYDTDEAPCLILEFIGGEPLLEIDLMDYIVEYFKFKAFSLEHPWAENYMISITSNGVLFRDKKVQDFIARNPGKVSIGITIDGNKELHDSCRVFHDGSGSYDIVEKSIQQWLKTDEHPQTKITLCPQNVMHLNAALKNIWSLGIVGAFTNCVFEEGWETNDATILYNEMIALADYLLENENYRKYFCSLFDDTIGKTSDEDKNWCGGNGEMLAIAPDGRCFPCIRFMKYSLSAPGRKEQPIGDIWKGIDSIEDNKWLQELKNITMSSQSDDKCINCPISSGCALCTGYNYDKFGTPNKRATFACEMHQARVMANYYYWNKLYKKLNLNKKIELKIPKEWALKIIAEDEYNVLVKGGI
jgi:uncharacterized protein